MTEEELKEIWEKEKPIYEAWGEFVESEVSRKLVSAGLDLKTFLKVPAKSRVKDTRSLVDKALYRNKNYENPYEDIEDKVGVRFVVLLIEDIKMVCKTIENSEHWNSDACKHFDTDKEKEPLLFTYQSVHYILRPKRPFKHKNREIHTDVACEVQIRTLLQHAHAELTHDAIYKSKKAIKPTVQRTVAKSMALIETTDEFFSKATHDLNAGPLKEFQIQENLDSIYESFTELKPHRQKSSLIIWDTFETVISEDLTKNITEQIVGNENYQYLKETIRQNYSTNNIYQQSIVLFLYWMLVKRKRRLQSSWPFGPEVLEILAADVGVSILND